MKEELLKGLTEEQIAKLKNCKSQEDLLNLAREEGVELTEEQLEAVNGGCFSDPKCPECGSSEVENEFYYYGIADNGFKYTCKKCGHIWWS